jgi:hypothetical protein
MARCDGQTALLASARRKFVSVIWKGSLITIEEHEALMLCLLLLRQINPLWDINYYICNDDFGTGYCVASLIVFILYCACAGSNPAEAVGLFGRKILEHTFLRRGSKAVCPMSHICGM